MIKTALTTARKFDPESVDNQENSGPPRVTTNTTVIKCAKDCYKLVDEKIVMGLARALKMAIAVQDSRSVRLYKPPNNSRKKLVTLGFNGTTYRRVPNDESVLTVRSSDMGDADLSKLTCSVCQNVFERPQALVSHMRCHTSKFCKHCGEEFVTEGDGKMGKRASSMVVFHEMKCSMNPSAGAEKPKKKPQCVKCDKSFNFYTSLLRHRKVCGLKPEEKAKLKRSKVKRQNDPLGLSYQEKINALKSKMLDPF